MKKHDLVLYKQRESEIIQVDHNYVLIKDVKNGETQWVIATCVQDLKKAKEHD